jgi:hypothetical protein
VEAEIEPFVVAKKPVEMLNQEPVETSEEAVEPQKRREREGEGGGGE